MIRLSVVIPTYRNEELLRETLRRLRSQTLDPEEYELLVADNNRDDAWAGRIRNVCDEFGARYLREDRPGAGAARAAAVEIARGAIIVFADDDVEVEPDFLQRHLGRHEGGPAAVIGSIEIVVDTVRWFERHLRRTEAVHTPVVEGRAPSPGQFYGVNASAPRLNILDVGNFDPDFRRRQDTELAYRLQKSGLPLVAAPEIRVRHRFSFTPEQHIQRARRNGYYFALFLEKHPERRQAELRVWYRRPWMRSFFWVGGRLFFPLGRLLEPLTPWLLDRCMNAQLIAEQIAGYEDFQRGVEPR